MPPSESLGLNLFERMLAGADALSSRLGRSPARAAHLTLGVRGEEAAFFYLRRQGYIITARRWRSHRYAGDVDLIGWDDDTLSFIEVKTRSGREIASAESAVDDRKRRTLRKIARHYLRQLPEPPEARFDVLSIYFEAEGAKEFRLFRGAFEWDE